MTRFSVKQFTKNVGNVVFVGWIDELKRKSTLKQRLHEKIETIKNDTRLYVGQAMVGWITVLLLLESNDYCVGQVHSGVFWFFFVFNGKTTTNRNENKICVTTHAKKSLATTIYFKIIIVFFFSSLCHLASIFVFLFFFLLFWRVKTVINHVHVYYFHAEKSKRVAARSI